MIRENQRLLNHLNMLLDGMLVFLSLPVGFWARFYLLPNGIPTVPFAAYVRMALVLAPAHVLIYAFFGFYESVRKKRLYQDVGRMFGANTTGFVLFQMSLFLLRGVHFSRGAVFIYFVLVNVLTIGKLIFVRKVLRHFRGEGYNQKHVVVIGDGRLARQYVAELHHAPELGLVPVGYVSDREDW